MGRRLDQCSPEERHWHKASPLRSHGDQCPSAPLRDLGQEDVQLASMEAMVRSNRVSALWARGSEKDRQRSGCLIAEDVFAGEKSILGIAVDERAQRGREC